MNKIDYGFNEVNLFEGEMNSDWFLKINPKTGFKLPVLVDVRNSECWKSKFKSVKRDQYQQWRLTISQVFKLIFRFHYLLIQYIQVFDRHEFEIPSKLINACYVGHKPKVGRFKDFKQYVDDVYVSYSTEVNR